MSSKEHVAMTQGTRKDFDLDQLLHPAGAFGHPQEVVSDPDLTVNEKRAILASWASDACGQVGPAVNAGIPLCSDCVAKLFLRAGMRKIDSRKQA
jgi:hypothetical protein